MYKYKIAVTRGFPMDEATINNRGIEGWRLVGVACTTEVIGPKYEDSMPYETEAFWYYFVREVEA